jgi:hypothetical protein
MHEAMSTFLSMVYQPLRETPFAECLPLGTRQRKSLSSVFQTPPNKEKPIGKCHVFWFRHTTTFCFAVCYLTDNKTIFSVCFFYLQQSNKICFSSHSKRFHSFFTWLRLKKIYIKNCMSRKDLQLLIRKFFLKFNLNMCFLLIEYRRDTCEATHSYIYLLLPPSHIKDCNFKFSRTYKWRNGKTYLFAKSSKFCHANQIWPFN